jgi:hypothetical protein
MNPERETPRDESDDALDRMIRAATTEPPPEETKERVIESAAAFTPGNHAGWWRRGRSRFVAASAGLAVAAACALAFFLMPPSKDAVAWEDVNKAVTSQSWIRVAISGDGQSGTMWLSPERQVWAARRDRWFVFKDGRERATYEYRMGAGQIVKTALSEVDTRLVSSVDYASQGLWFFGTERVISQERREVREDGKKWIEFDLVFWRGDMSLGTLRVDPATRLPVYLLLRSRTDAKKSLRYDYTYSGDGPADIYALGVPAGTKIDDRMPPKDAARVLDAIAASRARIGDFRLVVAELRAGPTGGRPGGFIVWRKGDRWRIDMCYSENQSGGQTAKPPDGLGWGDPFLEKLKLSWAGPLYLCDGLSVYFNRNLSWPGGGKKDATITWKREEQVAPRDLLSGEGRAGVGLASHVKIASLVYPDLSGVVGIEFDPRPPAMPGCVLLKWSALGNAEPTMRYHQWYYLDPTKGYAVVRAEEFELPPGAPADPLTARWRAIVRLEDFQQSPQSQQLPQGFWYPSTVQRSEVDLEPRFQKGEPEVRHRSFTVHYHMDFNVALPDSLFAMDEAGKPGK